MTGEPWHFCTYFDQRFLSRGLALHHSLMDHCRSFHLWVLCLDEPVQAALSALDLPHVTLTPLAELEAADGELPKVKGGRTTVEYYFTCTPAWPLWVFNHAPHLDLITYLDADLFFFADPAPIFEELGARSVGIISHRFPPDMRWRERYGIYNVGWVSFRRDENGIACLRWWRERCIEWCHDREESGRFGDQKYLDVWPELFDGVAVLEHPGANVAAWNLATHPLSVRDSAIWVKVQFPLLFFHFHGLRRLHRYFVDPQLAEYGVRMSLVFRKSVLDQYLKALAAAVTKLQRLGLPAAAILPESRPRDVGKAGFRGMVKMLRALVQFAAGLLTGGVIYSPESSAVRAKKQSL
jgi:hypothetical protein